MFQLLPNSLQTFFKSQYIWNFTLSYLIWTILCVYYYFCLLLQFPPSSLLESFSILVLQLEDLGQIINLHSFEGQVLELPLFLYVNFTSRQMRNLQFYLHVWNSRSPSLSVEQFRDGINSKKETWRYTFSRGHCARQRQFKNMLRKLHKNEGK